MASTMIYVCLIQPTNRAKLGTRSDITLNQKLMLRHGHNQRQIN